MCSLSVSQVGLRFTLLTVTAVRHAAAPNAKTAIEVSSGTVGEGDAFGESDVGLGVGETVGEGVTVSVAVEVAAPGIGVSMMYGGEGDEGGSEEGGRTVLLGVACTV